MCVCMSDVMSLLPFHAYTELALSNNIKHTANPSVSSSFEFDELSSDEREDSGGAKVWGKVGDGPKLQNDF
jgi:hypothetical protein